MANGRTIRLFLTDGEPEGIITGEIINWTGMFISFPRQRLAGLGEWPEAEKTGVYLLAGPDPVDPKERLYIGESDNVVRRLKDHELKKPFWNRGVLIVSKDDNLTKAHVRFLENRLWALALDAGRAILDNGSTPTASPLPKSDASDMEQFLGQIRTVLPLLNIPYLEPYVRPQVIQQVLVAESPAMGPVFIYRAPTLGLKARMQVVDNKYVVLAGSQARKEEVTIQQAAKEQRQRLIKDGKLCPEGDHYIFTEDYPFGSVSAAISVVYGGNANGRTTWKLESDPDTTFAQWEDVQAGAQPESDGSSGSMPDAPGAPKDDQDSTAGAEPAAAGSNATSEVAVGPNGSGTAGASVSLDVQVPT